MEDVPMVHLKGPKKGFYEDCCKDVPNVIQSRPAENVLRKPAKPLIERVAAK